MYLENITDFLGKADDRYFSNGFKHFDFVYENLTYQDKKLTGSVSCEYNWDKKSNRHFHLGTVEYIALAATVCEKILETEFNLSPEEIASSQISYLKMKIQSCIDLSDDTRVSVSGQLISIQKIEESANLYKSCFEVRINNTLIKIEVKHPIYIWFNVSSHFYGSIDAFGMYCTGYKKRNHLIRDIVINETLMSCTASVSIEDYSSRKSGLGSQYCGTMLTDIILISGQMVQALFFRLEKMDRSQAGNLWLKEFEVLIEQPDCKMDYEAKIMFEDVKTLKKGNETWKSVQCRSELGSIVSNIKMVSQVNNNNN
jgi:hypothetical protein